jgi:predicted metal-dependent enzyme (double-stranded beta helix superfamily)
MGSMVNRVARSWVDAVRTLVADLPRDVDAVALERFREQASELAWRDDRPTLDTITDTPLRYRRVLVSDPDCHSFSALLIAWPPDHRTALHDHDGLWGAELVLDGALAVDEYQNHPQGNVPHPTFQRTMMLGIGDATVFADRSYIHSCRNLSDERGALTLHVYGGPLENYLSYQPDNQGTYRPWPTQARLDDVWSMDDQS